MNYIKYINKKCIQNKKKITKIVKIIFLDEAYLKFSICNKQLFYFNIKLQIF